ncbi:MAG: hypothetical protein C4523_16455 [Myxococcales bacterium]|nr:MAG: hypothetical protein C4523_16455 [Myxococcales bacterium]
MRRASLPRTLALIALAAAIPLLASCRSAPGAAPAAAVSLYRAGDYVIYEYTGALLDAPVKLEEEILEQEGLRLTIDVVATRNDERREWIQVVTDTPENQRNNVVDELYEVQNGQRVRLENADNADLLRLYEWTEPPKGGPLAPPVQEPRKVEGPTGKVTAYCAVGSWMVENRPAHFEYCASNEFLWTHLSMRLIDAATGKALYEMRAVESGRRAPRPSMPQAP